MKNKIQNELAKLAEKILHSSPSDSTQELKEQARQIYEKLVLLSFTEKHLLEEEVAQKQETQQKPHQPAPEPVVSQPEYQPDEFAPDGTEYRDEEAITEPATEKIKDIVAQMPPEAQNIDTLFEQSRPPEPKQPPAPVKKESVQREESQPKKDFRDIGVDYDNLPNFEPLNNREKDNRPKSINDRLKKGINIGLNERLAYIKHLFDGNSTDYNRVLSQLNTIDSLEEARKFIEKIVKPDYNHWQGKEDYEERFMEKIENKFRK